VLTSGSSGISTGFKVEAWVGTSFAVRSSAVDCSECSKAAAEVAAALRELAEGRLDLAVARLHALARSLGEPGRGGAR
jgi:hypothetical protein